MMQGVRMIYERGKKCRVPAYLSMTRESDLDRMTLYE